jgi:hypothetical protein
MEAKSDTKFGKNIAKLIYENAPPHSSAFYCITETQEISELINSESVRKKQKNILLGY